MKPLTVHLPDDVYERAERRAAGRGVSLPGEVVEMVKSYSEGIATPPSPGQDLAVSNGEKQAAYSLEAKLQELAALSEECRLPNWDGQGAAPVSRETVGNASRFLHALPPEYPPPSLGVEPDGHLTLEWYRDPRWILSLSVSPESDLYYAALFDTSDVRGREVLYGDVPDIILGLIRRVFPA